MNILITGGCGFLGARLARTLLAGGPLALAGGAAKEIARITLADRVPPPPDLASDARIQFVQGDLYEQAGNGALPLADTDAIFHLAAAVSGECEADFDLGMRSNLDTTRILLDPRLHRRRLHRRHRPRQQPGARRHAAVQAIGVPDGPLDE
jgi:nucleoside-diphosphate-sugar epimerase